MKILSDQPIQGKSDDALSRISFSEHIATGILKWESKESLCIALHGSWGSGKTSIINLCLEAIKEKTKELLPQDQPLIIRFHPWLISGHEQLIKSFLDQLQKALGKPGLSEYAKEASEKLKIFEDLLGYASWIPTIGQYAGKTKEIVIKVKDTAQAISQQMEEDVETNKESICKALLKLHSPMIIIIDDVDRLTTQEIRQLFQLIKAVADFPNTIYFLAFDHKLVEKALEQFQSGSETRYLEKIVQLDFEVPSPSRSKIGTILLDGLDDIIGTIPPDKSEQDRWNNVKFGTLLSLCRNLRDVKRYLNAVYFKFPIIKGEVNSLDLLIIEAIHILAPDLYKVIKDNKDFLISDSAHAMAITKKDKNDWVNGLPELAPKYCRSEIKEMLSYLFPEIESTFEGHGWGSETLEIWRKNQRVCISAYFDFYFQGTLPEEEVSARETDRVIELLVDKSDLTLILRNYMSDGRIRKLLPKIETYLEEHIDQNSIKNLILALFESGEELPLRPEGMFESTSDWIVTSTSYRLLKLLNKDVRKDTLLDTIHSSQNAVVFPLRLMSYIWREWNPDEEKKAKKSDEEKLLSNEESEEIKDLALSIIRRYRDSEILYKSRHLSSTLYYWEKWGSVEEVKKWVETILSDEKKIPEFLGGFGGFSYSAGMGSHYSSCKFKINFKALERFCNVEQLKNKCEDILNSAPEWLTGNYRFTIQVFLDSFIEEDE